MKWSIPKLLLGSVILSALIILGCGEEPGSSSSGALPESQGVKKTRPKAPVEVQQPADTSNEPKKYVYLPGNRRDPFEPLIAVRKPILHKREIPEEELTPLQKYDVGQFRLLGVIIGKGKPTAMVLAPDGKSYILQSGVKVGKNDGIVVGVDSEGVKVKEFFYDFSGETKTGVQEIRLPTAGGEK